MPDWVRQILGVLGLAIPLSALFWKWQSWKELLSLWLVIGFGGGALLIAFIVESWYEERTARKQAEQREQAMMQSIRDEHGQSK